MKPPAPLVSFASDIDVDEAEGDGIFAALSDREGTTNNPTSTVTDTATVTVGNTIEGGPGDDTLTGTAGDDAIFGYGGNDTLIGLAGNDTPFGGVTRKARLKRYAALSCCLTLLLSKIGLLNPWT